MNQPIDADYKPPTTHSCGILERPKSLRDLAHSRGVLLDSTISTATTIRNAFEHDSFIDTPFETNEPFGPPAAPPLPEYLERAVMSPGHPRRQPSPVSAMGHELQLLAKQLVAVILNADSPSESAALLVNLRNTLDGAQMVLCVEAVDRAREAQSHAAEKSRPKFARVDPERVAADIVAIEHRQNHRTASDMVAGAVELHSKFPRIWNRVIDGKLPAYAARKIAFQLRNVVDSEKRSTIEAVFLNRMDRDKSPAFWNSHLSKQLDRVIAEIDPEGVVDRENEETKNRKVSTRASKSGMATLSAKLPALECATIAERLDSIANEWTTTDGDERSADELRADALVQLVTGLSKMPEGEEDPARTPSHSEPPVIQPRITLVADVDPAHARTRAWAGNASVAKQKLDELLAEASRAHLQVVPARYDVGLSDLNGLTALLERIDADFKEQTTYVPTDAVRRLVVERDGTCRHPGCTHPAQRCDLDHVTPFNKNRPLTGGLTREDNLISLCRHHHRFKTHGNCSYRLDADGTVYARIGDDCIGSSSPQGHRGLLRGDIGAEYEGPRAEILEETAQLAQAAWELAAHLDELLVDSFSSEPNGEKAPARKATKPDVIELRSALREKKARRFRERAAQSRWNDGIHGSTAIDLNTIEF